MLFALWSEGVSQQLFVICEPGYRVYLDDTLKGVTSDAQDGLFIDDVALGAHELTVKKSTGFVKRYSLDIHEGVNELVVNIDKSAGFPRKDGYYVASYNVEEKKSLFKSTTIHHHLMLYMGEDDTTTKNIEFTWAPFSRYGDESRNSYTFKDMFYGFFLDVYDIEDLRQKRYTTLFSGEMKVASSGDVSVRMILSASQHSGSKPILIGNGRIKEDGEGFTLRLRSTKGYDKIFDNKELTFEFVPMPSSPY